MRLDLSLLNEEAVNRGNQLSVDGKGLKPKLVEASRKRWLGMKDTQNIILGALASVTDNQFNKGCSPSPRIRIDS